MIPTTLEALTSALEDGCRIFFRLPGGATIEARHDSVRDWMRRIDPKAWNVAYTTDGIIVERV